MQDRRASTGSVHLIQQALIDSGYPLPKFGPDGKYGNETAQAVINTRPTGRSQPRMA
jgi:peptidoglycan hydrolase-like protein with peptidoglycan-binding domain